MEFCEYELYLFSQGLVTTQHASKNDNNFTEDNVHIIQSTNKEELRSWSSVKKINKDMIYPTKSNSLTCNDIFDQTIMLNIDDFNAHGYSDNDISSDDLVKHQYLQLPYPTIRNDTMEMEYKYYLGQNNRYPVSSKYSMKLDYLNHYLYQGQNNFEYVSSLYYEYEYLSSFMILSLFTITNSF